MAQAESGVKLRLWNRSAVPGRLNLVLGPTKPLHRGAPCLWFSTAIAVDPSTFRLPMNRQQT